jgi:hypothetical protein
LFGFVGNFVGARLINHGYLGKALGVYIGRSLQSFNRCFP